VMAHLATRYAAVGILERSAATMEVLRCRVPWVHAVELPNVSANAQTWHYPVKLTADAELMGEHVAVETMLYEWAGILLSVDLLCCR